MKKAVFKLKHWLLGNYCSKCHICYFMDKSHASAYDGVQLCEYPSPSIKCSKYNQIVDCDSYVPRVVR